MLPENGGTPDNLDALFPAFVSRSFFGLADLVPQELGVFVVAQVLEARGAVKAQIEELRKILVVLVEEPKGFGSYQYASAMRGLGLLLVRH
jgi:hypothetical protein